VGGVSQEESKAPLGKRMYSGEGVLGGEEKERSQKEFQKKETLILKRQVGILRWDREAKMERSSGSMGFNSTGWEET